MANKNIQINGVNFERVTGKAQVNRLVDNYLDAWHRGDSQLWHVYGTCSRAKENAFDDCDAIRRKVGGYTMFIVSHCTCFFTLAYELDYEGKKYVVKETPSHRFICEVPEDRLEEF